MFDVVALGESLIDCTPAGKNEMGMDLFSCNPGGAPANVLAMNAKLGGKTAFIGMVGHDSFGAFLKDTMDQAGIDTQNLCMSDEYRTTLAFVQLDHEGNRSFSFYRKPGADVMLTSGDVNASLLMSCHIFHFGGVSLTDDPCRTTTLKAAQMAKESGAIISYDPNYRPALWKDSTEAKAVLSSAAAVADVIKVSDEELTLLTGETDCRTGAQRLAAMGPSIILVTMGKKGSFFYTAEHSFSLPTYHVSEKDTTGAGDAFLGALHNCIRNKSLRELLQMEKDEWRERIGFANAAGSLTTTKKGAIPAMPDRAEISALMQSGSYENAGQQCVNA